MLFMSANCCPISKLWCVPAVTQVNPPAVGFFLLFVGTSWVIGWFAINYWR